MTYRDLSDKGNGVAYQTGRLCIEPDCNEQAGTAWSPYWCVAHNIDRLDRIGSFFDAAPALRAEINAAITKATEGIPCAD